MNRELIKQTREPSAIASESKFFEILGQYDLSVCKTMQACVAADTPAIGQIIRQCGDRPIRSYIAGRIVDLRDFVNLRGAMTDDQTVMTAELILSEFPNVTLADIVLIFRRAKLGQWGEFYGRLDGQMILSWFGKYFDERCAWFAERSMSEAGRFKGDYLPTSGSEARRVKMELDKLVKKSRN